METSAAGARRSLLTQQAALAVGLGLAVLAAILFRRRGAGPHPPAEGLLDPLRFLVLGLAVVTFPILRMRQRRLHGATPSAPPEHGPFVRGYRFLFAGSLLPGILGLLFFLAGGAERTLLLTAGLSLGYLLFMTPPRDFGPPR